MTLLTIRQKLVKLKRKLLVIIMMNILLLRNLIRKFCCKISTSKNDIAALVKKTDFDDN